MYNLKRKTMKTFKDLDFKEDLDLKKYGFNKKQAKLIFNNDYEVSVITGYGSYGNDNNPYELAVLYKGVLDYDNIVTNGDVRGYLNEEEVTELMIEVQKFK